MRTTLIIDDDVLDKAKAVAAKLRAPFRRVVNGGLRDWIPWLREHLSFPFQVKRMEDEDDAYFTDVAKHKPFRLDHIMEVIGIESEEDDLRGVIVQVKEVKKKGYVPLCDLEVTSREDRNFWPVREYVVWDANR